MSRYYFEIHRDENPENPRLFQDCLTKMVCFYGRHSIGDEHNYRQSDYRSWSELEKGIRKNEKVVLIQPLFMYKHGGITISTKPFNCHFDSGQIGFIYITREQVNSLMGYKVISTKRKEQLLKNLLAELEEYDAYLRGDCYYYKIMDSENSEDVNSCCGFYSEEDCEVAAKAMTNFYNDLPEKKVGVLIG